MKKILLYSLATLISSFTLAQSWEHGYGYFGYPDAGGDAGYGIMQADDGNFVCVGFTSSLGAGRKDVLIIKTDTSGQMLWQKTVGDTADDFAYGIVQSITGDYYIVGETKSYGAGSNDVFLIKLNSSGDIVWTHTYGGVQSDNAKGILSVSATEIVLAGTTSSYGAGGSDVYLLKVDSAGTVIWTKTFGLTGNESANCISAVHDGGFIIGGNTESYGSLHGYGIRTDSNGDTLWTKAYDIGIVAPYYINGVTELTNNNEFVFCGTGLRTSSGNFLRMFCINTDLNGNFSYRVTTGTISDAAQGILKTPDGGWVTIGYEDNFGQAPDFIKWSSTGVRQWRRSYQRITSGTYSFYGTGYGAARLSDGRYILGGVTYFSGQNDMLIIKTDTVGNGQVYPPIGISTSGPTSFCQGNNVTLSVPSGYLTYNWVRKSGSSLSWISGATSNSYVASLAGTYFCSMSDTNGIYHTVATLVSVTPVPTATVTPAGPVNFCAAAGGSATLTANTVSGATYQWTLNSTNISGATSTTYSPTTSGNYNVIVTNSCSSSTSNTVIVNAAAPPTAYFSTSGTIYYTYWGSPCGNVVMTAPSQVGTTYQWYNSSGPISNATSNSFTAYSTGNYYVVTTNACGSSSSTPYSIWPYWTGYVTPSGSVYACSSVTLSTGQFYYGTQWFRNNVAIWGATSNTYTATTSGTYGYSYYLPGGCGTLYSQQAYVTIETPGPAGVSISASPSGAVCSGQFVMFTPTPVNGGSSPTYQWRKNNVNVGTGTTYGSSFIATGDVIDCIMTSNSPCVTTNPATSNSITMTIVSLPSVMTMTGGGSYCSGGNGVPVGISNSQTGVQYQLRRNSVNTGSPVAGTGAALSFGNQTVAGTYTVIGTNTSGCTRSMSGNAVVTINPLPVGTLGLTDASCNQNNGAIDLTVTAGTSPFTYLWSNGATTQDITGLTPGTYSVTITDANGCTQTQSGTINNVNSAVPSVSISVSPSATICAGQSATFIPTPVYGGNSPAYQWQVNSVNVATGATYTTSSLSNNDNITCIMTSNDPCASVSTATSNSITITVNSLPTAIAVNGGGNYCSGGSGVPVGLSNSQTGVQYQLRRSSTNVGSPVAGTGAAISFGNQTVAGTYTVIATNGAGCTASMSGSATVVVNQLPNGTTTVADAGCSLNNGSINLTVTSGTAPFTYLWSNNATTEDISGLAVGTYSVTITDANGCTRILSATVNSVSTAPAAPAVPSGYTYICRGFTNNSYSVPPVPGAASYTWTAPAGATISGQGTNSVILTFSSQQSSGNVCVYASNACGNSPTVCKALTVVTTKPPAPSSISGPAAACASTSSTYSCPLTIRANTYTWTVPANATIASGQGTNSVVVNFSSAFTGGTIKVTASNCIGTSSACSMTISSVPGTPGNISGPNQACTNQTVAYSINAVSGATTYLWTPPAGSTIASGQGTTSVTVTFGTSGGTLSVRAGNACGYGNPKNKSITVNCTQRPELITDAEMQGATLYPNPATENVTVTFNASQASHYTIRLIDLTGRIIFSETENQQKELTNLNLV
jgi:hypothetical protein